MSSKRFSAGVRRAMVLVCGVGILGLVLPAVVPGEVVRLKDGSTLKGRLLRVDGDTLTIRLSIGVPVKIHRAQIESIAFTDSIPAGAVLRPADPVTSTPPPAGGAGTIMVKFEDRKVSTKITIDKKKFWDEKVRSNDIVLEFVVDGKVAYTAADTTTDKTIYKGVEKQLKNDAELPDFSVQVPSGRHRCTLVVRNRDPDTFHDSFEPAPLNQVLDFDELSVAPGGIIRLDIKMDKGFLRTSSPKFYRSSTSAEGE